MDDADPAVAATFNGQLGALGLTQTDLGRILQINITTVNRWATGRRPVPMSVALLLLAWVAHPRLIPGRAPQRKSAAA